VSRVIFRLFPVRILCQAYISPGLPADHEHSWFSCFQCGCIYVNRFTCAYSAVLYIYCFYTELCMHKLTKAPLSGPQDRQFSYTMRSIKLRKRSCIYTNALAIPQKCENILLTSSHLSVRMEQPCFQRKDFHEIWFVSVFRKCVEKIRF
jgi:hypothetical protein